MWGSAKAEPSKEQDYSEDSNADTDGNFVLTFDNKIVEIQTTAETNPFNYKDFNFLLKLAQSGTQQLFKLQKKALN